MKDEQNWQVSHNNGEDHFHGHKRTKKGREGEVKQEYIPTLNLLGEEIYTIIQLMDHTIPYVFRFFLFIYAAREREKKSNLFWFIL